MDPIVAQLAASPDPTIAYQARVRLLAENPAAAGPAALRAAIADSPRARALLSGRAADGTIPRHGYAKWQGPHWTLVSLALIDYPPGDTGLLPIKRQVDAWLGSRRHAGPPCTTHLPGQPERVRRCASQEGNAILAAMRLGLADEATAGLVERLVALQWPDGGWNCDRRPEARASSFVETTIPARALDAYARAFGHEGARRAADAAFELLLSRELLWRRRDGQMIRPDWGGPVDLIHFPIQFHDVLFALQAVSEAGLLGDPRAARALALLRSKRLADGGFPPELRNAAPRRVFASRGTFADWGPGGATRANPFVTIAALAVLREANAAKGDDQAPASAGA